MSVFSVSCEGRVSTLFVSTQVGGIVGKKFITALRTRSLP